MAYRRQDVVACAIGVLDSYGLADLSMRRLAQELGVQPSALYHHFANKQRMLAAIADEILRRGERPRGASGWEQHTVAAATWLRESMLAYRDGAELVVTVNAFGLGEVRPRARIAEALNDSGLTPSIVATAAGAVLHYVLGHTLEEQTQLQAGSAGAIEGSPREESDFETGLGLVLDGIRAQVGVWAR